MQDMFSVKVISVIFAYQERLLEDEMEILEGLLL